MTDPAGGLGTGGQKPVSRFFQRYRLFILVGVVVLALVGGGTFIYTYQTAGTGPGAGGPAPPPGVGGEAAKAYDVLPENRRPLDEDPEVAAAQKPRDPFAGPMVLTGLVMGGGHGDLALIEAGDAAYVVGVGDTVANVWTVAEIKAGGVLLKSDERELRLELAAGRAGS